MFRKYLAVATLAAVLTPAAALAVPTYTVEIYDNPSNLVNPQSFGLNDNGQIVGVAMDLAIPKRTSFLWEKESHAGLGPIEETSSMARDINNNELVAGFFYDGSANSHAYIWNGSLTDISHPDHENSYSFSVNNLGEVLVSTNSAANYVWTEGNGYTSLNTEALSSTNVYARGLNDAGQVVGDFKNADGDWQPFFRDSDGTFYEIPITGNANIPDEFAEGAFAIGINELGEVVGTVMNNGEGDELIETSFRWSKNEGLTILDPTSTRAFDINNEGLIVGVRTDDPQYILAGVLWENDVLYKLADLISLDDPLFGNIVIIDAHSINDQGQISTSGVFFDDNGRANFSVFLLTPDGVLPVPAPASLGLMLCGAGGLLVARRKQKHSQ